MSQRTNPDPGADDEVAALLRSSREAMEYPPTPRVAARVRSRLETEARATRRQPRFPPAGWLGSRSPRLGGIGWSGRWALGGLAAACVVVGVVVYRSGAPTPEAQLALGDRAPSRAAPAAPVATSDPVPTSQLAAAAQSAPSADSGAGAPTARRESGARIDATGVAGGQVGQNPPAPAGAALQAAATPDGRATVPAGGPDRSAGATADAPRPAAPASRPSTGTAASVSGLAGPVGFTPLAPELLGKPDGLEVLDGGRAVHLLYGPRPGLPAPPPGVPLVRLTEAPAAADERQSADGQLLTWQGGEGRWAADEMGGGTLEWIQGGLALRLETPLTSAEAAAIAASVAPLAD